MTTQLLSYLTAWQEPADGDSMLSASLPASPFTLSLTQTLLEAQGPCFGYLCVLSGSGGDMALLSGIMG